MGLFNKLLAGADKAYDAKETLEYEVFKDRRYDRAEKLAAAGDPNTAVITGIKRRYNGDFTETDIRLEWYFPEPRVGGIHYGAAIPPAIRLGSTSRSRPTADSAAAWTPPRWPGCPARPRTPGGAAGRLPSRGWTTRRWT